MYQKPHKLNINSGDSAAFRSMRFVSDRTKQFLINVLRRRDVSEISEKTFDQNDTLIQSIAEPHSMRLQLPIPIRRTIETGPRGPKNLSLYPGPKPTLGLTPINSGTPQHHMLVPIRNESSQLVVS